MKQNMGKTFMSVLETADRIGFPDGEPAVTNASDEQV